MMLMADLYKFTRNAISSFTMNTNDTLYMFAIVPPPHLASEIHQLRLEFSEKYGFVKALKPPVHITLFPPFSMAHPMTERFEQQIRQLQPWANTCHSFDVALDGFGFFNNPNHPVVFINVTEQLLLQQLHASFVPEFTAITGMRFPQMPFRPHITIGYRDVTPAAFPAIQAAYATRTYNATFACKAFYLWKHNRINWQAIQEFTLE